MKLSHYFYKTADTKKDNALYIAETLPLRDRYMSDVHVKLYAKELDSFKGSSSLKSALLYIGGGLEHHSLSRYHQCHTELPRSSAVVKSQIGYVAHKYALLIGNIDYLSINANACASAMHAIYEAQKLINKEDYDEVFIVGEEWVEPNELLLYKQLGIGITCSDGFVVARFEKYPRNYRIRKPLFHKATWLFHQESACLNFSKAGYAKVLQNYVNDHIDVVKTHGTGTDNNNEAEDGAIADILGDLPKLYYKQSIGHSQGVSALLEICVSLDDKTLINKNILALASGLGNFYGGVLYRRDI
jgi:hypothetical protein